MDSFFTKEDSLVVKGISILMMIAHHVLTIPEWWPSNFNTSNLLLLFSKYLNTPLKLCISIYAFITGFSFYEKNKNSSLIEQYKYVFSSIYKFLLRYLLSLLIIVFISTVIYSEDFSIYNVLLNFLGLSSSYCVLSWYVSFYILTILLLPIIYYLSKNSKIELFIIAFLIPITFSKIFSMFCDENGIFISLFRHFNTFYPCVFSGLLFSKYDLFSILNKRIVNISNNRIVDSVIVVTLLLISFFSRYFISTVYFAEVSFLNSSFLLKFNMDIFYAPIFIFCICYLLRAIETTKSNKEGAAKQTKLNIVGGGFFKIILRNLGVHSTSMWFIHGIIYNRYCYDLREIFYSFENPVLILLFVIIVSYALSVIIDYVYKLIYLCMDRSLINKHI